MSVRLLRNGLRTRTTAAWLRARGTAWVTAAALGLALCLAAPSVKAGPNELLVQAVKSPLDSGLVVLRYTFGGDGFFYSTDGGESFALACRSSLKPEGETPRSLGPMAIDGDDRIVVGIFGTMLMDDGKGCGWSRAPELEGKWMRHVTPLPSDPRITYAISSNGGEDEDGNPNVNGVYRREPGGEWEPVGMRLPMLMSRLHIVELPEGELRFYISAVDGEIPSEDPMLPGNPNFVILVSDDEGESYTTHAYGNADGDFALEAVDPTNPDRIVASITRLTRTEDNQPVADTLLVSSDQGASFTEYATVTEIGGVLLEQDGTLWLGDAGDSMTADAEQGLFHAASLDEAPEQLSDEYPVRCLLENGGELFACQRYAYGKVDRDSGEFTPTLDFSKLENILSCEGESTADACRTQLCSAFCGTAHFPQAPMCVESFESTVERGCGVRMAPVAGAGGSAGDAADGGAVEAGAGGAGGMSSSAGQSGANAGASAGDGDEDDDAGDGESGGKGCGCATVNGAARGREHGLGVLGLLGVLVLRRRVRRKHH